MFNPGDTVQYESYGVTKTARVVRIAHDIVHLDNGRWIHAASARPEMSPERVVATGRQFGQKIGAKEAQTIARLLKGRH